MVHPALAALGPHSTLADLPLADCQVSSTTPGQEVAGAFEREQDLAGIIVCQGEELVGMISRQRFYREMQRPFSSDIYFRRPTALLLGTLGAAPLALPSTTSIPAAAQAALQRAADLAFDPLVVTLDPGEFRLLDIHTLLMAQAQLLEVAHEAVQHQKDLADAANRAKSAFLANMSHEIRTPLNGILGMTELLADTQISWEQREYLDMVKTSADTLLTLINDILDLSKIEAGRLELDPSNMLLRDTLEDALRPIALRAHKKGLELSLDVAPNVPDALIGDALRLRQVVVNLVGNAIKFTERGEIVVSVALAAEKGTAEDATHLVNPSKGRQILLAFSVRDTGIGIPPEKHALIFDPFVQAESSTTRRYGGTGLGLTISARIVGLFGGRIWLDSAVGSGTTFRFTARFGVQLRVPQQALPMPPLSLTALPVLVVDDNATNRRILEELLRHWQMRPFAVEGARPALAELHRAASQGQPFPLVLLDARMPEMDGFALAEEIKRQPHLAGATVMMLSSADGGGDAARCRALGVARYMTKPIKRSDLLDAIVNVLSEVERQRQRDLPPMQPATKPKPSGGYQILLAEDHVINQRLAVGLLQKRGHQVTIAATGAEAVAAVADNRFDLVLMDIEMPEMDGYEATHAIRRREEHTGQHIPIIAMTANAFKEDRERCLAAGMDGFLTKPISASSLHATLDEVMSRVGAAAPAP